MLGSVRSMAEEERWLDKLKLGQAKLAIVEEHHIDSGVEQRMPLKARRERQSLFNDAVRELALGAGEGHREVCGAVVILDSIVSGDRDLLDCMAKLALKVDGRELTFCLHSTEIGLNHQPLMAQQRVEVSLRFEQIGR